MENIFSPLTIGKLQLSNRLVAQVENQQLADKNHELTEEFSEYYAMLGDGDSSMIISESFMVDQNYPSKILRSPSLWSKSNQLMLKRMINDLHRKDVKFLLQLCHPGCRPHLCFPDEVKVCSDWTKLDLRWVRELYSAAAYRAKHAGADGVDILVSEESILGQFLLIPYNTRKDNYGPGSITDRLRLTVEVIKKIRTVCGKDFLINVQLSDWNFMNCLLTEQEVSEMVQLLELIGVNLITISNSRAKDSFADDELRIVQIDHELELLKWVKETTDIPVVYSSHLDLVDYIEEGLESNRYDLFGFRSRLSKDQDFVYLFQRTLSR
ncbi:hypothetical protein [Enterococcus sp. AZ109]|uniref:oxidoreductase n=1 Tax=Enterococcus sp. AZ109 TaxID=2774634 RepID=UPI003F233E96